ncbi:MAG: NTPase [Candidatus Aenigmatarchaeota archaeon]
MKIFLTGKPRAGKSTIVLKIIDFLKNKKVKVGGFITPEIVESGKRVGFYVKNIFSNEMEIFASVDFKIGPRIGKYGINIGAFEKIALKAIDFAIQNSDVIILDEIGKMEFLSKEFEKKIYELILIEKPLIATLHRNFIKKFKDFGEIIEVNEKNRNYLPINISRKILAYI